MHISGIKETVKKKWKKMLINAMKDRYIKLLFKLYSSLKFAWRNFQEFSRNKQQKM